MRASIRILLLATAAGATAAMPTNVAAQTGAATTGVQDADTPVDQVAPATPPSTQGLEEIVVTARKTSERLSDTPAAITAFSEQDLENRQVRDVAALSQFTPGLS